MVKPCHASELGAWEQVSCYCERAFNPDFWAEPLNALTNFALLFAALMAFTDYRARNPQGGRPEIVLLILLLFAVGTGSFLFHTYATIWSRWTDILPIAAFVAVYLVLALKRFVGLGFVLSLALSGAIVIVSVLMFTCSELFPGALCGALGNSFNGSIAYAPALVALGVVTLVLLRRGHEATNLLGAAFCFFVLSLLFRTLDGWPVDAPLGCMVRQVGEQSIHVGTHLLWHLINAIMLYLLLRAIILHGDSRRPA